MFCVRGQLEIPPGLLGKDFMRSILHVDDDELFRIPLRLRPGVEYIRCDGFA